jgi:hypothetical protein
VALERRSTGAAEGGSDGDLRCCGCGLSRARERELEWGKGGDGAALPFKRDPRRGGGDAPTMERGRRRRLRSSASEAGRLEVGGDADVRAPAAIDC